MTEILPLFRRLLSKSGKSSAQAAREIGVGSSTFDRWIKGQAAVSPAKLGELFKIFSPDETDAIALVQLAQPKLQDSKSKSYIRKKIQSGNIQHLISPALDLEWLAEQPENIQAGWLLAAMRERKGLSQEELADTIEVKKNVIQGWERGEYPIDYTKLKALHTALNPNEDEMVLLTRRVQPKLSEDADAAYIRKQIKAKKIEHLAFPALDPEWLKKQPESYQAGWLVAALRERAGMEQSKLADIIDEAPVVVSNIEIARNSPKKHVEGLCGAFGGEPGFNEVYFREVCERSDSILRGVQRVIQEAAASRARENDLAADDEPPSTGGSHADRTRPGGPQKPGSQPRSRKRHL
jgi:transcriptional regulator with XRE-family HTH domain